MPTKQQYDVTLQTLRDIDCRISVLNFNYVLLDELSGITTNISLSVDADSDIRRTADISIVLKDDLSVKPTQSFYWQAGNKYWFDKYVQIYTSIKDVRTNEQVWVNQGIYCINSPSIMYDAVSNTLSFQAVDLMSKLTGMRNGQLEGMTYTIPAGSSIRGAVESILLEQGFTQYVLNDAPEPNTPYDVSIDAGGTAYELLCQLRDINANWEMFFDVNGAFHWQQIPSGKVIIDPTTGETGEPAPIVDGNIWDKTYINYSYDTSFEDVKNYVEVLGKVHEPNEFATVSGSGNKRTLTLSNGKSAYVNNEWIIAFDINVDDSGEFKALPTKITSLYVVDKDGDDFSLYGHINISNEPITFGNQRFVLKMTMGSAPLGAKFSYLGFLQPQAIAFENNPDSPFYVGNYSGTYTCSLGTEVDFASSSTIADFSLSRSEVVPFYSMVFINVRPYFSKSDYDNASVGTQWSFKFPIEPNSFSDDTPIQAFSLLANGFSTDIVDYTRREDGTEISLDLSQDYLIVVERTADGSDPRTFVLYYPLGGSEFTMSTTNLVPMPKFTNQIRYVCVGDEYDNIYSNSLAEQRARYEIYLRARLHDNITITTVPIYWLDVNEIIEFDIEGDDSEHDLWLVKSISTEFGVEGTQTITAMRYYPLYAEI